MNLATTRNTPARFVSYLLALSLVAAAVGCGSGNNNNNTTVGLLGNWNIVMFPTGSPNPSYVFAMAISQEGSNNYSGSPITYTGTVQAPSNQCINPQALRATATTNGSNFTMTVTDTTTQTVITMNGTLATGTNVLSGTYNNPASQTCSASSGTFTMTLQ
jgi:hypothetical protein